ncbi:MAG TPA: hypothetical protein VM582_06300, partial [Candidatus Thermoplasmatota archaeon]|nr:hypothetical protein [Candidatus Thermoplasmatota archaeon]
VCCPTILSQGESIEGAFTPRPGLVAIVAELVWADATFDLDLWITAPDYEQHTVPQVNGTSIRGSTGHYYYNNAGQLGSPDGRSVVVVTDEEALPLPGEWGWFITSKSSNGTPFTIAISEFYGEPPAPDFTAVPPA